MPPPDLVIRMAALAGTLALAWPAGAVAGESGAGSATTSDTRRHLLKGCARGDVLAQNRFGSIARYRHDLLGCPKGQRGRVLLHGGPLEGVWWSKLALAGRMVAYAERVGASSGTSTFVSVRDFVSGARCISEQAGTGGYVNDASGTSGLGARVTDLVLHRSGAMAFVAGPSSGPMNASPHPGIPPWEGYEVIALDADGFRQLDAGGQIARSSLELDGRRLRWTNAGQERRARLSAGHACRSTRDA